MDDIDMNTINTDDVNKEKQEEDSCIALDNIQKELKIINDTFNGSIEHIKNYSPFIENGSEQNMEKEPHNFQNLENYAKNREEFDGTLKTFGDQMNEHFNNILEMTKKLKNYEEFNMTENQLKEKLNQLKEMNKNANEEMNKKLKNIDNIFNDLNADYSMKNELNNRDDLEDIEI